MLDLARVVAVHPESNTVDVVLLSSGAQVSGVQVMSGAAGAAHGFHDLPQPLEQDSAPADPFNASQQVGESRATLAVLGSYRGLPLVMGFLFPQVAQCLFAERDRAVYRHASDFYATVDGGANFEVHHPSGVSLRIAETPGHDDLTGRDFDGKWALTRNTGRSVHVQLSMPNATVHLDPAGNVSVVHAGNLDVSTGGAATIGVTGNAAIAVGGTTTLNSAGAFSLTAPSVLITTPQATVTGRLVVQGGLAVSGGTGASAQVTGSMQITGDVASTGALTNNGVNVGSTHRHTEQGDGNPVSTPI